jgi:hypothetical protein
MKTVRKIYSVTALIVPHTQGQRRAIVALCVGSDYFDMRPCFFCSGGGVRSLATRPSRSDSDRAHPWHVCLVPDKIDYSGLVHSILPSHYFSLALLAESPREAAARADSPRLMMNFGWLVEPEHDDSRIRKHLLHRSPPRHPHLALITSPSLARPNLSASLLLVPRCAPDHQAGWLARCYSYCC